MSACSFARNRGLLFPLGFQSLVMCLILLSVGIPCSCDLRIMRKIVGTALVVALRVMRSSRHTRFCERRSLAELSQQAQEVPSGVRIKNLPV